MILRRSRVENEDDDKLSREGLTPSLVRPRDLYSVMAAHVLSVHHAWRHALQPFVSPIMRRLRSSPLQET